MTVPCDIVTNDFYTQCLQFLKQLKSLFLYTSLRQGYHETALLLLTKTDLQQVYEGTKDKQVHSHQVQHIGNRKYDESKRTSLEWTHLHRLLRGGYFIFSGWTVISYLLVIFEIVKSDNVVILSRFRF